MAGERSGQAENADDKSAASPRQSNRPLIIIFVLTGLILLGTFVYAFMMTIPGSMPGMNH